MSRPPPGFIFQLLTTMVTGAGIYAGMRSDFAALSERVAGVREIVVAQGVQIDKLRDHAAAAGVIRGDR